MIHIMLLLNKEIELDGADVRIQFVKLYFKEEDKIMENRFPAQNPNTGEPFV